MTTATTAFQPSHAWDRNFYLAFVLICWLGVIMGFAPAVSGRLQGQADYPAPLVLHVHAAAFVGWLVLLTSQVGLIRLRRTATHRRMGLIGVALLPVMLVTALVSEVYSQRFYVSRDPENLRFFIIPIFYVVAFGALAATAFLRRGDPPAHKRLIVLATTVIVGAAYARWWGEGLEAAVGKGFWGTIVSTFFATNLILLGALAHDLATRRRAHVAYALGIPALLAMEVAVTLTYHSDGWPILARRLIGA